jgi:branched-chain amino acid aminotransferase
MQKNWIYLNGELVLGDEATISPYDHGFLYGHGLFETMRVYHGKVFCLREHLTRLEASSRMLGWGKWFDAQELTAGIYQTLEKNGLQEASLRLTVSRGKGACHPDPASCQQMTVIIFATPLQPLSNEMYEQGWKVVTSKIQRNLTSPLCGMKVANYLDHILAKVQAKAQGGNEALLLNTKGSVAEGTMCNMFFVREGKLLTPDVGSGLLPGITRGTVLQLAVQAGIVIEERPVYPDELLTISEMFITSSLLEIMAVTQLDGKLVGNGSPGGITRLLQLKYKELVHS